MARGQQKIQSQQRNAKKQAELKKANAPDQKKSAEVALIFQCEICKTKMPDPKTYKQHFDNKHPKAEVPTEIKDVVY